MKILLALAVLAGCAPLSDPLGADSLEAKSSYAFRHVPWGGGYVTGIVVHPTAKDAVYARTDMGTAYRWDAGEERWISLLDRIPATEPNLLAPESVAVDPTDPTGKTVYLALGRYAQDWATPPFGDLAASRDGGRTWTRAGLALSIASNDDQPYGERLTVTESGAVLYASRGDGLMISRSRGEPGSWKRLPNAPTGDLAKRRGKTTGGLAWVLSRGKGTLYVGVIDSGVARSEDAGATWTLLPGSPKRPNRAALGTDGTLLVTHDAGVARLRGTAWTDVTPGGDGGRRFAAVAINPANPKRAYVARLEWGFGNPLFRTEDGGETWKRFDRTDLVRDVAGVGYMETDHDGFWSAAPSSFAFDPLRPGRLWLSDWMGAWRTEEAFGAKPRWTLKLRGHEQGASLALLAPTGGAPLISGAADADGYRHPDLTAYPTANHGWNGTKGTNETTGLDASGGSPDVVARVAAYGWSRAEKGVFALSRDNGRSWSTVPIPEGSPAIGSWGGRVAVDAGGKSVVWLPAGKDAALLASSDLGTTWRPATGVPKGGVGGDDIWNWAQPLAADRVKPNVFYLVAGGAFHRSADGGRTWTKGAELGWNEPKLAVHPSAAGTLVVALGDQGLHLTGNGGKSWTKVRDRADLAAIGAGGVLFAHASDGLFRSDDNGRAWTRIGGDDPTFASANTMAADARVRGRVYLGTNGRGIWIAEPVPR